MTLSEKIKNARKAAGLTQQQVADKVGIAKEVYQMYEYGTRNPRLEKLKAIADACGVDLEYFGADVKGLQKSALKCLTNNNK